MGAPSSPSAFCGDNQHSLCNGNTQDAAGQWVYCQCPAAGCTCATLTRQDTHAR